MYNTTVQVATLFGRAVQTTTRHDFACSCFCFARVVYNPIVHFICTTRGADDGTRTRKISLED